MSKTHHIRSLTIDKYQKFLEVFKADMPSGPELEDEYDRVSFSFEFGKLFSESGSTPNLDMLAEIFGDDWEKIDQWIAFSKKMRSLIEKVIADKKDSVSSEIYLDEIIKLLDGASFKEEIFEWIKQKKVFADQPNTAIYSKLQVQAFFTIQNHLSEGKPISLGSNKKITKGGGGFGISGGEDVFGGLAGGHAYTIISTKITDSYDPNTPENPDGGKYFWIQIRNPWGKNAYAKHPIHEEPVPGLFDIGKGIFFLELSQLTKYFNLIDVGAPLM